MIQKNKELEDANNRLKQEAAYYADNNNNSDLIKALVSYKNKES